jgi:hypothetical protein
VAFIIGAVISGGTLIVMLSYLMMFGQKRPSAIPVGYTITRLGWFFGLVLLVLGPAIWILEVVTIEQMIAHNSLQHVNQWTFGQTLSVLMVLAPAVQLAKSMLLPEGTGDLATNTPPSD